MKKGFIQEFIPCDLAIRMKQLGFNEPCFGCYSEKCIFGLTVMSVKKFHTNSKEDTWNWSAPTWHQAFNWFREKHGLWFRPDYYDGSGFYKFQGSIHVLGKYSAISDIGDHGTYEEAELACLEKLLDIVEAKIKEDGKENNIS
jgi:hypothetical protein